MEEETKETEEQEEPKDQSVPQLFPTNPDIFNESVIIENGVWKISLASRRESFENLMGYALAIKEEMFDKNNGTKKKNTYTG